MIHAGFPVEKFVLSSFTDEDFHILKSRYDGVEEGIRSFLQDNPAKAMNLLNSLK